MPHIVTNLWFNDQGEEAAKFYCSVFPNSAITNTSHYGESSPGKPNAVMTVDFDLDGSPFTALNGGPQFTFDEAISLLIQCADQAEVDHYWDALVEGGEPGRCGWLKDKYGLSWQVVPLGMAEVFSNPEGAQRATAAMMGMAKLDLAALQAAADNR